jgi:ribosomal protein L37AE/L43A
MSEANGLSDSEYSQAIELLWSMPDDATIGDFREQLAAMNRKHVCRWCKGEGSVHLVDTWWTCEACLATASAHGPGVRGVQNSHMTAPSCT